ncbi:hypothetical protein CC2G_009348 [Coprinopsis cinerea AmutBmut pab1-1]|nr:hypothetical protein CC2G_009348 [Coprinopsis cinerea AmutBmut pab1-1]
MSSSASAQAARHEAAMKAKRQQLKEQERARIDAGLPIIVHRAAMSSASEHAAKHEAEQVEKKRREGRGNRIGTADATTTPKNRTRNKRPATDAPPEPLPIVSELVEYYKCGACGLEEPDKPMICLVCILKHTLCEGCIRPHAERGHGCIAPGHPNVPLRPEFLYPADGLLQLALKRVVVDCSDCWHEVDLKHYRIHKLYFCKKP